MDSVKGNVGSLTGTNALGRAGDSDAAMKEITDTVPVTVTETEVIEMNKEIGLHKYTRPFSRLYLATAKAVSYLMVRKN